MSMGEVLEPLKFSTLSAQENLLVNNERKLLK